MNLKMSKFQAVLATVFLLIFFISFQANAQKKRVSCVGNSITAGYGLFNASKDSYPSQLLSLLGSTNWVVGNYGDSGRTMLKSGGYSYWDSGQYTSALSSTPNIVVIGLGTNDSKDWLWNSHAGEFKTDYKSMVQSFQNISTKPDIWIFLLVPGEKADWGIYNSYIDKVNVKIKEIALEMGLGLIDQHSAFAGHWPGWFQSDGVHPTVEGALNIAQNVKDMLLTTKPVIVYANGKVTSPEGNGYQWYIDGVPVAAGDQGQQREITVTKSGKYKVSIKLSADKETRIVSNELEVSLTGTVDLKTSSDEIIIFPNPTSGFVNIRMKDVVDKANYSIYDTFGNNVLSGQLIDIDGRIDVRKLSRGTYMLCLNNKNVKLIKQ